jgi:hypothetical protein
MAEIWRYSLQAVFSDDSVDIMNVHHFEFDEAPTPTARLELGEQLDLIWEARLQADISTQLRCDGWEARRVDIALQPSYLMGFQGTSDGYGDQVGGPLPPQVSLVVNFSSATAYPRRGRSYLGVYTEVDNTGDGYPDIGVITNAGLWANDLLNLDDVDGITVKKVACRYEGSPAAVAAYNAATFYKVSPKWATLRSRRR